MTVPAKTHDLTARSRKTKPSKSYYQNPYYVLQSSTASVRVDEETALTYSAIYRAVGIFAGIMGSLPFDVFRRVGGQSRESVDAHPVWQLIAREPNTEQKPYTFRETMTGNMALWGNAYAEIERNESRNSVGTPIALWYIPARQVAVRRYDDGSLYYEVTDDSGRKVAIPPADMLHVQLFGDGIVGKGPITLARETIGAGIASDQFAGSFWGNSGVPSAALEHPGAINEIAVNQLRESFEKMHRGPRNAHKVLILREGMKFNPIGMPVKDSQFIETRQDLAKQVARWFGLPNALLGEGGEGPGKNLDEYDRWFIKYSLMFWIKRWEEEIDRKLLMPGPGGNKLFCRFNLDSLLRGDPQARFSTYAIGRQWGIYNANECRAFEDMDPIEGGAGEDYWQPVNVITDGTPPPQSPTTPPKLKVQDDQPRNITEAFRKIFTDVFARLVHRETKRLTTLFTKHAEDRKALDAAVCKFYSELESDAARELTAPCEAFALMGGEAYDAHAEASRFVEESRRPLLEAIRGSAILDSVKAMIEARSKERARMLAEHYVKEVDHAAPVAAS